MPEEEGLKLRAVKSKLTMDSMMRQSLTSEDVKVDRAAARRPRTTTVWDNDPSDPIIQYDDDPTDPIRRG